MDEIPVWFETHSNYTITHQGESHVKVKRSGKSKDRITVVLCCLSDGTKLPPIVITNRNVNHKEVPAGLIVWNQDKSYMTKDLMLKWIGYYNSHVDSEDKLLILDAFSAHKSALIKNEFRDQGIKIAMVWTR